MKKVLACLLSICFLFGILGTSTFAENSPVEITSQSSIQPRANIVDVLSSQVCLVDNATGKYTVLSETYYRLNYVNGYKTDSIKEEIITTVGDVLNNNKRVRIIYTYVTW